MVKFKFSFGKINIIIEMITASVLFKHHLAFEIPIHYKPSIAEGKIMSPEAKCISVAIFFFNFFNCIYKPGPGFQVVMVSGASQIFNLREIQIIKQPKFSCHIFIFNPECHYDFIIPFVHGNYAVSCIDFNGIDYIVYMVLIQI